MLEGTCDEYPIHVPGISEESFDFMLDTMFSRYAFAFTPDVQFVTVLSQV
jgi:hypothetical protein